MNEIFFSISALKYRIWNKLASHVSFHISRSLPFFFNHSHASFMLRVTDGLTH